MTTTRYWHPQLRRCGGQGQKSSGGSISPMSKTPSGSFMPEGRYPKSLNELVRGLLFEDASCASGDALRVQPKDRAGGRSATKPKRLAGMGP